MRNIKWKLAIVGAAALAMCSSNLARSVEPPSSLEVALEGALQNHPDILAAKAAMSQARAAHEKARLEVARKVVEQFGAIRTKQTEVEILQSQLGETKEAAKRQQYQQLIVNAKAELDVLATELKFMSQPSNLAADPVAGGGAFPGNGGGPTAPQVPKSKKAHDIAKSLVKSTDLVVENAELTDVLKSISKQHKIVVAVNDNRGFGTNPITMELHEVTLAAALQAIEDQTGLQFVIREYGLLLVDSNTSEQQGYVPVMRYLTEHLGTDLGQLEAATAAEAKKSDKK